MDECRHLRVNGTKCRAAALRGTPWCYFHDRVLRDRKAARRARPAPLALPATVHPSAVLTDTRDYGHIPVPPSPAPMPIIDLPLIEDLSSIQLAISRILQALAAGTIEPKRAGLLLYGLQIAAQHLPKDEVGRWNTVADVALTDDGVPIALAQPGRNPESFTALTKRLRMNLRYLDKLENETIDQHENETEKDTEDSIQDEGEQQPDLSAKRSRSRPGKADPKRFSKKEPSLATAACHADSPAVAVNFHAARPAKKPAGNGGLSPANHQPQSVTASEYLVVLPDAGIVVDET